MFFFKSQRYEYFNNCQDLGLDENAEFTLEDVFNKQDELLEKEDANVLAINMSVSYFIKNFKKITKWKQSPKFEQDKKAYYGGIERTEKFYATLSASGQSAQDDGQKHDFLD